MKRIGTILAACGGVLALPWPVWASEAAEGKAPLPQLDVSQYPGLLFWLAISFPLLFLLIRYLAVPRLQRAQSSRQRLLQTDLEAAEKDNEQAKDLQESYEKTLAEARAAAQEAISSMAAAASAEEAAQRTVQQQELSHRLIEAEKRIGVFRATALKEGRGAAADLAEAIVGKLISGVARKKA